MERIINTLKIIAVLITLSIVSSCSGSTYTLNQIIGTYFTSQRIVSDAEEDSPEITTIVTNTKVFITESNCYEYGEIRYRTPVEGTHNNTMTMIYSYNISNMWTLKNGNEIVETDKQVEVKYKEIEFDRNNEQTLQIWEDLMVSLILDGDLSREISRLKSELEKPTTTKIISLTKNNLVLCDEDGEDISYVKITNWN